MHAWQSSDIAQYYLGEIVPVSHMKVTYHIYDMNRQVVCAKQGESGAPCGKSQYLLIKACIINLPILTLTPFS